jgi:mono/diheme cytochrome c family protein
MRMSLMLLLTLFFCLSATVAQDSQTPPKAAAPDSLTVPAAASQEANPVKPTPASLAQGKKYYGFDCAMCHGENGNGKGEVAIAEKLTIADFSDPATLKGKTDGELFYVLKTGHGHMPPEPIRVSSNELWNLVNYVRSLSDKKDQ